MSGTRRKVEWVGHRGAPRAHLENTLPAFEEAIRLGADALELDVHVTSDRAVVVHHDPGLGRDASPRALRGQPIGQLTAAQVAGVALAGDARVPRLEEVLELVAGRVRVYVEVKAGDVAAVVQVLERFGAQVDAAIHSFDHEAIVEVSRIAPAIPRGILFDRAPQDLGGAITRTGARDVWPRANLVTSTLVADAHRHGCRVIVWTVNAPAMAGRLADLGVDGICTDDLPGVRPATDQP